MATIYDYLRALGREVKRGRPALTLTPEERKRLAGLYVDKGLSIREVGAELGVPAANVRRRLKAAGIPMRSNAPRLKGKRKVSLHHHPGASDILVKRQALCD